MVKCPNCESTAQMRFVDSYHYTDNDIAEKYECDCGALLIRHYTLKVGILYTDESAKFIKKGE